MAELQFDPQTGIVVPDVSEVREDIGKAVQDAFQTDPNDPPLNIEPTTPMGQIVDALTAEVAAKNSEVAKIADQNNLNIAAGRYLDALTSLYFVQRKISEATIVQCQCTGLKGTFIPYGAIVQDTDGNQYRHNVALGATIGDTGTVLTTFSAVEHGALEVMSGTVNQIVTIIPGWDAVTNPEAGVTGRDRESDAELRNRYRQSVAINSVGNVATIQANLANVDGVIDVQVLENIGSEANTQYGVSVPAHGIAVCIFGGEDSDIAQTIFQTKMGGTSMDGNTTVSFTEEEVNTIHSYPIYRPTVENFYVKVEFYTSAMGEGVQSEIQSVIVDDALGQLENPRIGLAQTIYADRFRAAIYTKTTQPVKSIQIALDSPSNWTDVLQIDADVEPAITADNVQIVLGSGS